MTNRDRETGALAVAEWSTIQIKPLPLIGWGLFYLLSDAFCGNFKRKHGQVYENRPLS